MEPHLREQLARIHAVLSQHNAEEILINGARGCFLVSRAQCNKSPEMFSSTEAAADFARELAWHAGRRLDPYHPATGGAIDEFGLRWHAVVNPVAQDEIILSVRRHRFEELPIETFISNPEQLEWIEQIIAERKPILIAGPTGVGKTTFLVGLLRRYFFSKRVAILESLSEIPALSSYWFRMCEASPQLSGKGAISLKDVGRECMRLRPDVLVVGELRGAEAEVFLDMSQTGHGGCLATIHGGNVLEAKTRLMALAGSALRFVPHDFEVAILMIKSHHTGACLQQCDLIHLRT